MEVLGKHRIQLAVTAHCSHSPRGLEAAVRPVEPAIRCNRGIEGLVNAQFADLPDFRCGCSDVCYVEREMVCQITSMITLYAS